MTVHNPQARVLGQGEVIDLLKFFCLCFVCDLYISLGMCLLFLESSPNVVLLFL